MNASVASLKKKKNKDKELHEHSNLEVMNENRQLIKEINKLIEAKNKLKSSSMKRDRNMNQSKMSIDSRKLYSNHIDSERSQADLDQDEWI